ncbi:hypothetical protein G7Y89_g15679 [Cudoniella acicularis]|uniref:Uncharacterized protein n=1 Tax=Cudoniella acicularis TaxID=354080 RepID=A0A8H4QI39_9HELO|nr:hypothetical protein G7Y89_g15679 [Cudoniella acicularis]
MITSLSLGSEGGFPVSRPDGGLRYLTLTLTRSSKITEPFRAGSPSLLPAQMPARGYLNPSTPLCPSPSGWTVFWCSPNSRATQSSHARLRHLIIASLQSTPIRSPTPQLRATVLAAPAKISISSDYTLANAQKPLPPKAVPIAYSAGWCYATAEMREGKGVNEQASGTEATDAVAGGQTANGDADADVDVDVDVARRRQSRTRSF